MNSFNKHGVPAATQCGPGHWDRKGTDTLEPVLGALLAITADVRASSGSDGRGRGWGRGPGSSHITQLPRVPLDSRTGGGRRQGWAVSPQDRVHSREGGRLVHTSPLSLCLGTGAAGQL